MMCISSGTNTTKKLITWNLGFLINWFANSLNFPGTPVIAEWIVELNRNNEPTANIQHDRNIYVHQPISR